MVQTFKRSQIDHCLWHVFSSAGGDVHPTFRARIKKLLDLDRARAVDPDARSTMTPGRDRLAFNDDLAGGKGLDVPFTQRHVFRLAVALELLQAGFKQSEVMLFVQEVQGQLDRAYKIMELNRPGTGKLYIPAQARPGCPTVLGKDGVSLADTRVYMLIDRIELPETAPASLQNMQPILFEPTVFRGIAALMHALEDRPSDRRSTLVMEIAELFALIATHLPDAPVRRRGRP